MPAFSPSTAARISSSVSWGEQLDTGVITPPVAIILMTSTPALISPGPFALVGSVHLPADPAVTAGHGNQPAATIIPAPGQAPACIPQVQVMWFCPMSRMVVTPAFRV